MITYLNVDEISANFKLLADRLNCKYDKFVRTTDEEHKSCVQALWKSLEERDQIYLGAYEGWYSVRDEAFFDESELMDGLAPTGARVEWVKEESYFFKLSEYTDKLLELYRTHPHFIGPNSRINEVVSFVSQEGGLRDLSISRTTFDWGVPVPGNEKHVIYVWLDALANYISSLGYPAEGDDLWRFWPADLHLVGKDILRFHAIYWPAFLMGAGIEVPTRIFAHGWWTVDGEKMSKSVGNVVDPFDLLDQYGVDYVRYYLTAEISFGNDGDFSTDSFVARINGDLANDVGNLAQRVFTLCAKHCDGKIPAPKIVTAKDESLLNAAEDALELSKGFVSNQMLHRYCASIIEVTTMGNKYIDSEAPWKLAKAGETDKLDSVLYILVEVMRRVGILLGPLVPNSSKNLLDQAGVPENMRSFESLKDRVEPGSKMQPPSPIFPKIEVSK